MRTAQLAGLAVALLCVQACRAPQEDAAPVPRELPPPPPLVQPAANTTWETYHGKPSLDGVVDLKLPDHLALRWRYETAGQVYNTPVSAQGRVAFADSKGGVHVLGMDGALIWSKTVTEPGSQGRPPVAAMFDAPLLIVEDTLIACSATGVVHAWALDDGTERWVNETDRPVLGSPTFATLSVDGTAQTRLYFIDQSEGALQCLLASNGTLLWSGEGVARCDGSPAASPKHIVYGSCASALHIFSAVDGKMLREIPLDEDSQVAGGVVLLGDSAFSGSRSGRFIHANVDTGAILWSNTDCEGEAFSTPAVSADRVVFGANDACEYALDRRDGKLVWKVELEDTPSSAVIAGDKVLLSAAGKLHLLRLSDGGILWSYPVSDEITAPGMAGELVVVGGDDGTVSAFGGTHGA